MSENAEKTRLLTYISQMPIDLMVKLYTGLFGHGYLHQQLIKYLEKGNNDEIDRTKKVINEIERIK